MIRLPNINLPPNIALSLNTYQEIVNRCATYQEQVEKASALFKQCNTINNQTFKVVREKLAEMCCGARRCCYCEDSYADEIEHIKPKSLYPDVSFAWDNYLYACGPCNGPKNNNFKIYNPVTMATIDVTRKKGDPVVPPICGEMLLINPKIEDPLEYMSVDIIDTFYFVPRHSPGTIAYEKAKYTIDLLNLNNRDSLVVARKNAYFTYRARLYEYREKKMKNSSAEELNKLVDNLKKIDHPTIWAEIKRQKNYVTDLLSLFNSIPEALTW